MSEAGEQVERLARIIKAMDDELSASQAREAELQEKLEAAKARGDAYSARAFKAEAEYATILEHCRTLEARIKASQEQEPAIHVGYSQYAETVVRNTEEKMAAAGCGRYASYYAAPVIPPEIEELQRENERLKAWKESAVAVLPDYQAIGKLLGVKLGDSVHDKILPAIEELTRKLAEQQAMLLEFDSIGLAVCALASNSNVEEGHDGWSLHIGKLRTLLGKGFPSEELTRLLEEAKSKAVPEGWQLVPTEPTEEMIEAAWLASNYASEHQRRECYKAMLAAAPQPKEQPSQETDLDEALRRR